MLHYVNWEIATNFSEAQSVSIVRASYCLNWRYSTNVLWDVGNFQYTRFNIPQHLSLHQHRRQSLRSICCLVSELNLRTDLIYMLSLHALHMNDLLTCICMKLRSLANVGLSIRPANHGQLLRTWQIPAVLTEVLVDFLSPFVGLIK